MKFPNSKSACSPSTGYTYSSRHQVAHASDQANHPHGLKKCRKKARSHRAAQQTQDPVVADCGARATLLGVRPSLVWPQAWEAQLPAHWQHPGLSASLCITSPLRPSSHHVMISSSSFSRELSSPTSICRHTALQAGTRNLVVVR